MPVERRYQTMYGWDARAIGESHWSGRTPQSQASSNWGNPGSGDVSTAATTLGSRKGGVAVRRRPLAAIRLYYEWPIRCDVCVYITIACLTIKQSRLSREPDRLSPANVSGGSER